MGLVLAETGQPSLRIANSKDAGQSYGNLRQNIYQTRPGSSRWNLRSATTLKWQSILKIVNIVRLFQSAYFGESVTMLAFGAMAFLAAAVTMTLPESKNVKLPNTVDEAENIGNAVRQKDVGNSS